MKTLTNFKLNLSLINQKLKFTNGQLLSKSHKLISTFLYETIIENLFGDEINFITETVNIIESKSKIENT